MDKQAALGQNALAYMDQRLTPAPITDARPSNLLVRSPNFRIALIALLVVVLDQISKQIVLRFLGYAQELVVIDGFFKFVHWGNTGAAWSLFRGNNGLLAGVALVALIIFLIWGRKA